MERTARLHTTQTDKDRALIDSWFKLAASVLGVLLIIAGGMIGFFGVKTLTDAKAAAETAAQDAAKAKVKEVLQEPRIQKLVEETAQQLFKSGAFRQAIEGETAAQLKVAIPVEIRRSLPGNIVKELSRLSLAPRTVTVTVDYDFRRRFRTLAGEKVLITSCDELEPAAFAQALETILKDAGLTVVFYRLSGVCSMAQAGFASSETAISARQGPRYQQLKNTLDDFVLAVTGKHVSPLADLRDEDLHYEQGTVKGVSLLVVISRRVQ